MSLIQAKKTALSGTNTHARHAAVASVICAGLLVTAPELALAQEQVAATPNSEKAAATVANPAESETVSTASTSAELPKQADATIETKTGLDEQQKDDAVADGYTVTGTKAGETKYFQTEGEAESYAGTNGTVEKEELKGISAEEAAKLDESWKVTGTQAGETRYFASEAEARAYAGANGTVEHEVRGSLTKEQADALGSSWKVAKADGETKYFSDEAAAKEFAGTDGKVELEVRTGLNEQQKDDAVADGYKVTDAKTGAIKYFSSEAEANDYAAKNGGTVAREERTGLSAEEAGKLDESWKVTTTAGETAYFASEADARAYAGADGTVEHEMKDGLTKEQADALDSSWKVTNTTTGETRHFNNEAEARAFAGTDGKVEVETKNDLTDDQKNELDNTWQVTVNGYFVNGKKDDSLTDAQKAILDRAGSKSYSITRVQAGDSTTYIVKDADGNTITDQELAELIVSKTTFAATDPSTTKDRYYLKDGGKRIYVDSQSPITLSRDIDGTYFVIDADGNKQTLSESFVRSLAGGASRTYSITGLLVNADGTTRLGDHGEQLEKTITFRNNANIQVFKDGDDYYIADTDGTFLKLSPADVQKVQKVTIGVPADARTDLLNSDGTPASLKIQQDLESVLENLSITSDFVLYADTINEGEHIDGNICVNNLYGTPDGQKNGYIQDLYASGRSVVDGLDQYSIVLNDGDNSITFSILDSSIVAGTNIKAQNINNGYNKFGNSASATDVVNPKATDPNFSKAPEDVKTAIGDAIMEAEADPAFAVKNDTVKDHLADIIYAICQREQITDVETIKSYAQTILSQLQVNRTLDDIASSSQRLIDDSVSQAAAKAGQTKDDYLDTFTSGKGQCQELLNTLNAGHANAHSVFVVTLSSADLDNNSGNGVIGDNGLVEQVMRANANVGATIIFNVVTPKDASEIKFDKTDAYSEYDKATGYYFWNFGNYTGHIQNDWTNEGTVVAGNASFTKGGGSRDGGAIARTITQCSEIHQARMRSFDKHETAEYSYFIAPDTGYQAAPAKETVKATDPTFTLGKSYAARRYNATEALYEVSRYKATSNASYHAERYAVSAPTTYDVARYKATNATYSAERFAGTNATYNAERYKAANKLYDVEKTTITFHNDHDAPKPEHFSNEHTAPKHEETRQAGHDATQVAVARHDATTQTAAETESALPKTGEENSAATLGLLATIGVGLAGIGEALRQKFARRA